MLPHGAILFTNFDDIKVALSIKRNTWNFVHVMASFITAKKLRYTVLDWSCNTVFQQVFVTSKTKTALETRITVLIHIPDIRLTNHHAINV